MVVFFEEYTTQGKFGRIQSERQRKEEGFCVDENLLRNKSKGKENEGTCT